MCPNFVFPTSGMNTGIYHTRSYILQNINSHPFMLKYLRHVYDSLIRGGFISSDSLSRESRNIFQDIEDNYEAYRDYFLNIGLILEEGDGYYHFSRQEKKVLLKEKLERFSFPKYEICRKFDADADLREKSLLLYERKEKYNEIAEALVGELKAQGYIELVSEQSDTYQVVAAFRYLEKIVDMISIENSADDDIPQ